MRSFVAETVKDERAASLRAFFEPASIAVVGASPDPTRGGHRILENLLRHFDGEVHAVNPNADEVLGLPCYPSVASIPGDVDLAVVFIPAQSVPAVVSDCVKKGVRAVCIESGGFADAGAEGAGLQREIKALVHGTSTLVWGPNCAGYVSTNPPLSTSFVVTPGRLEAGNVALIAQSGMMAAALLVQILSQELFSVSKACSIGNKSDVDESDLLEYLAEDPGTEVIGLYLESIEDGLRFAAALDRAIERATVLALMGGLSERGAEVALSHTGSVASEEGVVAGLLRQRGALQVTDFMELVDLAGALAPLANRVSGERVAVLTFSGAAGVVSADLFSRHGLTLAELSPATRHRLGDIYPMWLEPTNPVDVWPAVELHGLERTVTHALEAILADDGVDAVLFIPLAFEFFAEADLERFAAIARESAKPIVSWPFGDKEPLDVWRRRLRDANIAVCQSLHLAVRTLEALVRRKEGLERRQEVAERRGFTRAAFADLPASREARTIGEEKAKQILAGFGLPVVTEQAAASVDEAVAAAEHIGYPVVVKLAGSELAHKTELEGVALGLRDADAVATAAKRLLEIGRSHAVKARRLLVQEMVEDGVETIVGARRDPRFGPVVVFGLGGVFVESLRDVAVRPVPLTASDVRAMIAETGATSLLAGGRGRPGADVEALVAALVAMSDFISTAPEAIEEAEVNPLLVRPAGLGVVAVDALIVLAGGS